MINNFELSKFSKLARYEIIKQTFLKKSGHLGGALSCADILVNIFNRYVLDKKNNKFIQAKDIVHLQCMQSCISQKKLKKNNLKVFLKKEVILENILLQKLKMITYIFQLALLDMGLVLQQEYLTQIN